MLGRDGTIRADELILVGVIGTGNRARQVIGQLPSPRRIVAIADCYQQRMNETLHQNNASEDPPANPADNNPGMARVDALNVNVGGLDLPEGTIFQRPRGTLFTVPSDATEVNVTFEGWNPSSSFSRSCIAHGLSYTDGDECGLNAFGGAGSLGFGSATSRVCTETHTNFSAG